MSNEMICPYCKKQLLQNDHTLFYYCDCYESRYMNGHPVLWQALIQAKQDLVIARKALEDIKTVCDNCRWCESNIYTPDSHDGRIIAETTNKALTQIEHKE